MKRKLTDAQLRRMLIRLEDALDTADVLHDVMALCKRWGVTMTSVLTASRKHEVVQVRHGMWKLLEENDFSASGIGRLSNRDHSTVSIALRKGKVGSL